MQATGVHLFLILLKAFRSISDYASRSLDHTGLGDSDFRVLEVLLHKGPMPVNAIGAKVFLTPGSISVAVDRLYDKGLVTREDNKQDRRIRMVSLTKTGRTLIEQTFDLHARSLEDLASVLTSDERLLLADSLKKLGKRAQLSLDTKFQGSSTF